jgi:hypothetical protein
MWIDIIIQGHLKLSTRLVSPPVELLEIYMYKILTYICTNSHQVSTCAPKEEDYFRLRQDVVREKKVIQALEKLLLEDAWKQKRSGNDMTYEDGSQSTRLQCKSKTIFDKVSRLLMPYWLEIMPNFTIENVLGWSILWVTSANDALEAHFDELGEWCMAVVFSVGSSGKLLIKTHSGENAPDEWITHEILGNSLYILRGSEHKHMSQVCDGQPGRRGVLVMFVKGEKTWPTTPAMVASKIILDVLPDYTAGMKAEDWKNSRLGRLKPSSSCRKIYLRWKFGL